MFQAAWKLPVLVVVAGLLFGITNSAFASDVGKAGAQIANQAAEASADLLKKAISGDVDAIMEIVQRYAIPAAIIVLFMFISYLVASFIGRIVGNVVTKNVDETLGRFLTKAVRNVLMVLALIGVLGRYNVDVTSFAAVIAACGFAVGMALQGTLGNFAAGVMLLVFRPFKVNDYVVIDGKEGIVDEIDLFTTRLNTLDNRYLIIPNGSIFGNVIENYTHNAVRRVDVNVGADYSADLGKTRAALELACASIANRVESPAPQVYLMELGGSSVDWQLRVWCNPEHYWGVRENLTAAAKLHLDAAKIGIPFPQLDLHVIGATEQEEQTIPFSVHRAA